MSIDLKEAQRERGRIQGRKNVINGHWARLQTPENLAKAQRASLASPLRVDITKYRTAEGSRLGGLNSVKNKSGVHSWTAEQRKQLINRIASSGGKATFAKGVGFYDPAHAEVVEQGQDFGRHVRWHVNRGKVNPKCIFCRPESIVA